MSGDRLSKRREFNMVADRLKKDESANRKKDTRNYIFIYSVVFVVMAVLVYLPYIASEKSFIWEVDGLSQHYLVLMYIGQWLREILHNIFVSNTFEIPLWDFSIGAGGDVLTTFNYYGLGDPLCLLSVFVPEEYTVYLYNFLIVARLYLAGLFFSFFCFRMKQEKFETCMGSFAYIFCGYALYASTRHPFFLMPMVFFPLLLMGAEKLLAHESPIPFALAVFGCLFINFYFSYMLVLISVIYVVVRLFTNKENRNLKNIAKTVGKFLMSGVVGAMLSCVVLLPVLLVFFGNGRSDVDRGEYQLFSDTLFYTAFFSRFMSYANLGSWTITGFIPLLMISVLVLFKKRGQYLYLKILFVIFTIIALVPALSRVMNGFAYVANRWIWGYAFLLAFISVVMFRSLLELSKKEKLFLVFFSGVYIIISALISDSFNISMVAQYGIFCLLIMMFICENEISQHKGSKFISPAVAVLCAISILFNSSYCYSAFYTDYLDEFVKTEDAYPLISDSVSNKMADEMDDEFCRYEQIENYVRNPSVVDDTNGVAFYWSLTDNAVGDYLLETGSVKYTSYDFQHLNRNTVHDALFAVKYFFASKAEEYRPYGYEFVKNIETERGTFAVYENKYALPLGFTYSEVMTRDVYESLSNAEKLEALMSNVLLEEEVEGYDRNNFVTTSKELEYSISCADGIRVENNKIIVEKKNAKLTLNFDSVSNCELYVDFINLQCDDVYNDEDLLKSKNDETESEEMTISEFLTMKKDTLYQRDSKMFTFYVDSNGYTVNFHLSTNDYQNYEGVHNFLANCCYSGESRKSVTIRINTPGEYSFDEINVIAQPMSNYVKNVTDRAEHILENVKIDNNSFSGEITLDESQILFLSVPYSTGFTAYVDGEEVEILRANTWGMALDLDEGSHTVEFVYRTPGLLAGGIISLVGVAALTIMIIFQVKKKKTASNPK